MTVPDDLIERCLAAVQCQLAGSGADRDALEDLEAELIAAINGDDEPHVFDTEPAQP